MSVSSLSEISITEDYDQSNYRSISTFSRILKNKLTLDSNIYTVYEDVLYNIIHHLENEINNSDALGVSLDKALHQIRNVFDIPMDKHLDTYEKVTARDPPEIFLSDTSRQHLLKKDEAFFVVQMKSNRWKMLELHCCLIKFLIKYELETMPIPQYCWSGNLSVINDLILKMHSDSTCLSDIDMSVTKWSAFAEIHNHHPLDLQVFIDLLDSIIQIKEEAEDVKCEMSCFGCKIYPFSNSASSVHNDSTKQCYRLCTNDEHISAIFWDGTKQLKGALLSFIASLSHEHDEKNTVKNLRKIFQVMQKLSDIEQSRTNLATEELYKESIANGTSSFIIKIVSSKELESKNVDRRLDELIRVMEQAVFSYAETSKKYRHVFRENINFNYAAHLYGAYDYTLAEVIKPVVTKISNAEEKIEEKDSAKMIQLYMLLKDFSDHGQELFGPGEYCIKHYYEWFLRGIDQWCEYSLHTALERIGKAITIDNLEPVVDEVNHSSSAVDVSDILHSVKTFLESLKWPKKLDLESATNIVTTDICRLTVVYFDKLVARVAKCEAMRNDKVLAVPPEVTIATHNINYLTKYVQDMFVKITGNLQSGSYSDDGRQKMITNTLTHGQTKLIALYELSVMKMMPAFKKLLEKEAKLSVKVCDSNISICIRANDLLRYFNQEIQYDFENIKDKIWNALLQIILVSIQESLEKKQTPIFYSNLKQILQELIKVFSKEGACANQADNTLQQINNLLHFNGLKTSEMIHKYYQNRYEIQEKIAKAEPDSFGVSSILSVQCFFSNNIIKLIILNCKNLESIARSRKIDCYVKVGFVPEDAFLNIHGVKTKVVDSSYLLFDECFEFDLTPEQRNMEHALIYFNIKTKVRMMKSKSVAEAFLSFSDIPEYSQQNSGRQIHLTLTQLQNDELETLQFIRSRSLAGDKKAKAFIQSINRSNYTGSTSNNIH